jgi:hypothetical protein
MNETSFNSSNILSLTMGDISKILSPTPFLNASLKSLKVTKNSSFSKSSDDDKYYSLELTGPIMIHNFNNLCKLFKKSHNKFDCSIININDKTIGLNLGKLEKGNIQSQQIGFVFSNHSEKNFDDFYYLNCEDQNDMKYSFINKLEASKSYFSFDIKTLK